MVNKMTGSVLDELSKYGPIRWVSGSLKSRYHDEVLTSKSRMRFLRGYPKLFWYLKIAFWRYAPRKIIGGLLLNLLGLQVFRHYVVNAILKPKKIDLRFNKLQKEGVQVVPELLSTKDVEKIRDFYNQHFLERSTFLADFSELIINSNLPHIDSSLQDNKKAVQFYQWLNEKIDFAKTYQSACGRTLRCKPWVSIIHHLSRPTDNSFMPQKDGNNIPHRDVFFPSHKIFIYLNDVTVENAAFSYYPKSHIDVNEGPLKVYFDSINHYLGDTSKPYDPLTQGTTYERFICEGAAGDSIFFNVQGIHRRGEYKQDIDRERLVLLIDFRQNDALFLQSSFRPGP